MIITEIDDKVARYERFVNPQRVASLRRTGGLRDFVRGEGCYLFDSEGRRYLDCDAGYGVFCLGRNHAAVAAAIRRLLDERPANMVSRDIPKLAGLVAEALARRAPGDLTKVLFTNSGSETTDAALKFARRVTGRARLLYLEHDFHGVTYGALSVTDTGDALRKMGEGFGPMLPECERLPWQDESALRHALAARDVAALILEPIQGATVRPLARSYLHAARDLCSQAGTVLIADEVLTGVARTGRFTACEHAGIAPDMLLLSKALSGGCVPVGALLVRSDLHARAYDRPGAFVHGSTFGENDFGMAAALATIEAVDEEGLAANAARQGAALMDGLRALQPRYDMIADVRGEGLLIGIELAAPRALTRRLSGAVLQRRGLLGHLVALQLLVRHRIIASTGARNNVLRFHPPLTVTDADVRAVLEALDAVLADTYRFPDGIGRFILAQVFESARARPRRSR